jgi:MSHA biogenesis protein MshJ
MKDKWELLQEKTEALSVRERVIIFITGIVLITLLWVQLFFTSWEVEQKAYNESLLQNQSELKVLKVEIHTLENKLQQNPNDPLQAENNELEEQLNELGDEIREQLAHLMPPQKMAQAMQQVLADYKGLSLISARNLPVELLVLGSGKNDVSDSKAELTEDGGASKTGAVIYTHGFEMKLKGGYFQALQFLQGLEEMKGFYWRALDYQVEEYPKGILTIELNTLSLEEEWIGV